jgi:hypothetical protein
MKTDIANQITAIAVAGLLLSGCARVEPWERGNLAKPQMTEPALGAALKEHVYMSREAAQGGNAVSGGGCGCY